jgi:hypothetical protein
MWLKEKGWCFDDYQKFYSAALNLNGDLNPMLEVVDDNGIVDFLLKGLCTIV